MAYKKAKGSKGISGAQSGSAAVTKKGAAPSYGSFAGAADSRPEEKDKKQSA